MKKTLLILLLPLVLHAAELGPVARLTDLTLSPAQREGVVELRWQGESVVALEATILLPDGLTATWEGTTPDWLTAERWSRDTLRVAGVGLTPLPPGGSVGRLLVSWTAPTPGERTIALLRAVQGETEVVGQGSTVRLTGTTATLWATPLLQAVPGRDGWRQPLYVEVYDPDLTVAPIVEIITASANRRETVALAAHEDRWRVRLVAPQVTPGDSLSVVYLDEWNEQGQRTELTVLVRVIGLWGNVSGAGWLNPWDAWLQLQMARGQWPVDPAGDLDGDGAVTVEDVLMLLEYLVYQRSRFPIYDQLD